MHGWRAGDAGHAMGGDEAMIVAGIGFRRSVAADEIVALVRAGACDARPLARDALARLATIAALAETPAFTEAARRLNVTAMPVGASLPSRHAAPHVRTQSARSGRGAMASDRSRKRRRLRPQGLAPASSSSASPPPAATCALARLEIRP